MRTARHTHLAAALATVATLTLLGAAPATAGDWTIGAGADAAVPLGGQAGASAGTGFGIDALVGYTWDLRLIDFATGLNAGYTSFADAGTEGETIDGGKALAYADVRADTDYVQPFARVGLGWAMLQDTNEDVVELVQGMSWSVLAGLRIPIVDGLEIDAHAGVRQIMDAREREPAWTWLDAGAAFQYRF